MTANNQDGLHTTEIHHQHTTAVVRFAKNEGRELVLLITSPTVFARKLDVHYVRAPVGAPAATTAASCPVSGDDSICDPLVRNNMRRMWSKLVHKLTG